jgi:hypothetical protein
MKSWIATSWIAVALILATTTSTMSSMTLAFASAVIVPHRRRRSMIISHHDAAESTAFGKVNRQQQLQWRHSRSSLHSFINDNSKYDDDDDEIWGFDDDDNNNLENDDSTRLDTLRSILESSWNQPSMGIVPTTPNNAAIAATDCISNAMMHSFKNHNAVMMIDLRLPSYDIIEGRRGYDTMAVYNFGVELANRMQNRGLVRKSLLLVRNGAVCEEIERVINSQRKKINDDDHHENDDSEEDNLLREWTKEEEADEFRKKLMSSWESSSSLTNGENKDSSFVSSTSSSSYSKSASSAVRKVIMDDTNSSSHRLWSMVGNDLNNGGSSSVDTFNDIIAAVDINARLQTNEDALIILSPYDTTDIVALRRILLRYGSSRTIVIVNSRFDTNPSELDNAVLVYGMLPLVATAVRSSRNHPNAVERRRDFTTASPGLRAVIMKRYPKEGTVYVDVNGDGFVEAKNDEDRGGGFGGGTTKSFPPPEWIAQRVQAHVDGLSQQRDIF